MKKIPPHLPHPSCSIINHERYMRLKIFLISTLAGLVAGIVGAVMMINAWYPTTFGNTTVVLPNRNATNSLDSSVVRDWRPRLIAIYDNTKTINKDYYLSTARVSTAVVVNAGGWAVAPSLKINKTNFSGLDYQGHELTIEDIVNDENAGLTFIKFSGADFRATASFAPRQTTETGRVLWGFDTDWEPYTVGQKMINTRAVQNGLITSVAIDPVQFSLEETSSANQVLITDRGEFVGFSTTNRVITPVWMVGETLPKIVSGQKPPFWNFNWQGSFVEAPRANTAVTDGFLVTEASGGVLKKGDIILTINGQKVNSTNMVELLMFAPDEFVVSVERAKVMSEIILKK